MRATSMVFYALDANQPAALNLASDIYGQALTSHGKSVARALENKILIPRVLFATLMLAYFEAMYSTSAVAYIQHIEAAAKMLRMAGPAIHGDQALSQVFFNVRAQIVGSFSSLFTKRADLFSPMSFCCPATRLCCIWTSKVHIPSHIKVFLR